jgi:manganese/zinc/iron transport system permease protein
VVLMSALIVAPGTAARQWTNKLGRMVVLSAFFGALAGVVGVQISSAQGKLPTGPVIVLCISAIVLFSLLFAPERGLVWEWVRRQRSRRRLLTNRVLEALYHMGLHHGDPYHPHSLRSIEAAVQRQGVSFTLNYLAQDGLVRQIDGDQWALTPQGYAHVQDFLLQIRVGSPPDLPPVMEKEEVLA